MGLLVSIVAASLAFWFIRILGASVALGPAGLPPAGLAPVSRHPNQGRRG